MENVSVEPLTKLGFTRSLVDQATACLKLGIEQISLSDKILFEKGILRCLVQIKIEQPAHLMVIEKLDAMLQYVFAIEHIQSEPTNTRDIEQQLQKVNWNAEEFTHPYLLQYGRLPQALESTVMGIINQLRQLGAKGETEKVIADKLRLLYFYDTSFSRDYQKQRGLEILARTYFPAVSYSSPENMPTLQEIYQQLLLKTISGNPHRPRNQRNNTLKK